MNNLCNPKYCLKMKILNGLLWIQWPWTFMHRCWCKLSYRFSEINVQACNSGLYGKYLFNILRNHQAVFRNGSTILHPHQHVGDIQFPYALKNTLFYFKHPDGSMSVVLICIFLNVHDVHFPCACLSCILPAFWLDSLGVFVGFLFGFCCFFTVKFWEFSIYPKHKAFIRCVVCKYIFPLCSLSVHLLNWTFSEQMF